MFQILYSPSALCNNNRRRQRSGIYTNKYHTLLEMPYGKSTKTQENIIHQSSAISQRVITMLQETDKTVYERQVRNINNKKGLLKKHRLGMASKKQWRAHTCLMAPNSPLILMWITTHKCLVRMKDP